MKLHQLLSFIQLENNPMVHGPKDTNILELELSGLFFDTREILPNSAYVAIRGSKNDGHQFIQQAIAGGAIALIVENTKNIPENFMGLVVEVSDSRNMLDLLAARYFDYPSQKLFCFGVTGTNGKTSITYMLEHILAYNHRTTGIMGTINHRVGEKIWDSQMTTPDPVTLQKRLDDFVKFQAFAAALEVSSHALDQKRAESVHFNTVIFTNLTHDHLDYHKTMDNYFEAKQKLFTDLMWFSLKRPLFAVVNIDDAYGRKLKTAEPVICWTYGQKDSDFKFKINKMDFSETQFTLMTPLETVEVTVPLTGTHTIYNVVAALAAALTSGITLDQGLKSLVSFSGVPGRLQKVLTSSHKTIFIDYAHTPDALENTLQSIQKIRNELKSKTKIITVFGCGGDRDKTKRPLMAGIAARLSDFTVITSDNPRTEDPQTIINDIKAGLPNNFKNFELEIDREKAIQKAISMADGDDVILIAGKGHEDYQIIGDQKNHFSDYEIAKKYLE